MSACSQIEFSHHTLKTTFTTDRMNVTTTARCSREQAMKSLEFQVRTVRDDTVRDYTVQYGTI